MLTFHALSALWLKDNSPNCHKIGSIIPKFAVRQTPFNLLVLSFPGGAKAELGASWIHGVLGNPLYELAVSKGLLDLVQTPKPHNVAAVTEDGRRLPFNVLQEIYEAYFWEGRERTMWYYTRLSAVTRFALFPFPSCRDKDRRPIMLAAWLLCKDVR